MQRVRGYSSRNGHHGQRANTGEDPEKVPPLGEHDEEESVKNDFSRF